MTSASNDNSVVLDKSLLYSVWWEFYFFLEEVVRMCSVKNMFLKILHISLESFFCKVAGDSLQLY